MSVTKSIVLIALALFLLWIGNSYLHIRENNFFTNVLQTANITETVTIKGKLYLVDKGGVFSTETSVPSSVALSARKLAYAKALAKRNPLMALPGTDVIKLDKNVALLSKLKQDLHSINATNTKAAALDDLYPTNFLSKLSALEMARQNFIVSGSDIDSAIYSTAAAETFSAYQKDARSFASAFAAVVPKESGKFATDGDIISREGILSSLTTLATRANTTAKNFAARTACTRGNIAACNQTDLALPTITVTPDVPITPAQLAQAQAIRSLFIPAHEQPQIGMGPMLQLPSTKCTVHMGDGASLFTFYTPLAEATYSGVFPVYIGDIRFNTTKPDVSSPFALFSNTIMKHVDYLFDSPMLHYSCLELDHDSGKLFAMQDTYTFAQTHALSRYATTTDAKMALTQLENKNLTILTQHDTEAYLVAARKLTLPADVESSLYELSLSYIFNSDRFDSSVGEILNDEETNIALIRRGWPINLEVPYVFFTRSSFSMLLLAENQSAVGTLSKLFTDNTLTPQQEPFIYYSQLKHTPQMIQQLINDIHFFYFIHIDPSLATGTK